MTHHRQWIIYLLGALFSLTWKWLRYCYHGRQMGKSIRECSVEWFFEASQENAVSWITTIAVVWTLGAVYIDRIIAFDALNSIPVNDCLSFLLGSLLEVIAPNIVKFIVSKIPGAQ